MDTAGIKTLDTITNGDYGSDTSEDNVSIDILPDAGQQRSFENCIYSTSDDFFDSLTGTPDTVAVWTPSLNKGTGKFDLQRKQQEFTIRLLPMEFAV